MTTLEMFALFIFCSFGPGLAFFVFLAMCFVLAAMIDYFDGKRMSEFKNRHKERKP